MYASCRFFTLLMWLCCALNCKSVTGQASDDSVSFQPSVVQIRTPEYRRTAETSAQDLQLSHNISLVEDQFVLDGKPLHIVSGSLHYFRLPAEYWRDRLRKLKAAGLNSVSTYVEWSYHEPEERQYSFEGDRDIASFVRIAGEEGLHVLLRPGPYICAERDLGGFPYWLLGKYPNIQLRTLDPDFINESRIWMAKLFEQLKPLLFGYGGPIILVQVENEYGSYGTNKTYLEKLRDIISEHVEPNAAVLYTTDGSPSYMFKAGSVSGALTTIDFGSLTDVDKAFKPLRRYMPQGPLMNSEYYPGWLTHWGENIQQIPTENVVKTLDDMLQRKINVNFYMFFGGTNFEFTAGANHGATYQPDLTSYDYDAPLSEAGDPTPKYLAIRETLKKYNFVDDNIPVPEPSSKGAYGIVPVVAKVELFTPKGRTTFGKRYDDVTNKILPTFEELRQRSGLVLYETTLSEGDGLLQIPKPRDWVYVFVDGEPKGIISRMYKLYSLPLTVKAGSVLSLFVESQGRINYGPYLHDKKGILSEVKFDGKILEGPWTITGYPLESLDNYNRYEVVDEATLKQAPILYHGHFTLPAGEKPLDTFLDTTGWGKGYVWINGHNLGRYWPGIGPQVTLYVPGVWLSPAPARNNIEILELEQASYRLSVQFIDYPILNRTGTDIKYFAN